MVSCGSTKKPLSTIRHAERLSQRISHHAATYGSRHARNTLQTTNNSHTLSKLTEHTRLTEHTKHTRHARHTQGTHKEHKLHKLHAQLGLGFKLRMRLRGKGSA